MQTFYQRDMFRKQLGLQEGLKAIASDFTDNTLHCQFQLHFTTPLITPTSFHLSFVSCNHFTTPHRIHENLADRYTQISNLLK